MRKPWNEYFMDLAFMVATRSTCVRKKVGAVIINPEFKAIIATGYKSDYKPQNPNPKFGPIDYDAIWDFTA